MSIRIKLSTLNNNKRALLHKDLTLISYSNNKKNKTYHHVYYIDDKEEYIYIPYAYAVKNNYLPIKNNKPKIENLNYKGELFDEQKEVKKETIQELNKKGSILLSLHVGWGKSYLALNLALKIKGKTLIIVNRLILIKQWKDYINIVTDNKATIQVIHGKNPKIEDAHFYIINAINCSKLNYILSDIETVITDETHLLCAATLYKSLFKVTPTYLIGLSATPYRDDGLDSLIDLYFGSYKIIRDLYRHHTVYQVNTGLNIPFGYNFEGKIDWTSVITNQAEHLERNELIINIIKKFNKNIFLVLCKRVEQGYYLVKRLKEEKEYVTDLLYNNKEFDENARILIATTMKCGVGFSHNKLNALILASDIENYFIQYLGRVFRTKDVEPLIFDIVDENPKILKKHFETRKKVYKSSGGTIIKYIS